MLVIGGGYIGHEIGNVFASLGSKVSLAEETSAILSWVDQDLVQLFLQQTWG